jgi:8-oxo-dGTP diphosphatase
MAKSKRQKAKLAVPAGGPARQISAGGAVFRSNQVFREWLLIKPRRTKRWQLPKGKIDPQELATDTAVREIFEETGVRARVLEKIEDIKYFFVQDSQRIFKVVAFYLMESKDGRDTAVRADWAHEIAEAVWVPEEEALKRLSFKSEKQILERGIEKAAEIS